MPEQEPLGDGKLKLTNRSRKWWRNAALVGAVATVGVPLITGLSTGVAAFVHEYFEMQKFERQLKLNEQKQAQEIRLNEQKQIQDTRQRYLDQAIDPERNTRYRSSVLRYLVTTLRADPAMRDWAQGELGELKASEKLDPSHSLSAGDVKVWQNFLALRKRQEQLLAVRARSTLSKSNSGPAGGTRLEKQVAPITENPGVCCVTCQGLTICARLVNTECGSCSAQ